VKWARGEGVFIGPKNSRRPVLRAYVQYLSTVVQRLFRTTRYCQVDSVNSAAYVHQSGVRPLYYSHSTIVLFTERTSGGGPPYICTTNNSVSSTSVRPH
jgi:hypothetical protein